MIFVWMKWTNKLFGWEWFRVESGGGIVPKSQWFSRRYPGGYIKQPSGGYINLRENNGHIRIREISID